MIRNADPLWKPTSWIFTIPACLIRLTAIASLKNRWTSLLVARQLREQELDRDLGLDDLLLGHPDLAHAALAEPPRDPEVLDRLPDHPATRVPRDMSRNDLPVAVDRAHTLWVWLDGARGEPQQE